MRATARGRLDLVEHVLQAARVRLRQADDRGGSKNGLSYTRSPAYNRRVPIAVRPLRVDEGRLYLEIVNRAIRGLAAGQYAPEVIEGWVHPPTEENLRALAANADGEIRLVAELDGVPAGIGALVVERSELRACYVSPDAARRGCGSAIVREIERLARAHGVARLELAASLNAEPFYAAHGYRVRERSEFVLPSGCRMPAVWMEKAL